MQFREYNVVRVIAPIPANRIDRNAGEAREPQVGDIGTILIVHSIQPGQESAFIVESVGADGHTLWMADILASELEQVSAGGT